MALYRYVLFALGTSLCLGDLVVAQAGQLSSRALISAVETTTSRTISNVGTSTGSASSGADDLANFGDVINILGKVSIGCDGTGDI